MATTTMPRSDPRMQRPLALGLLLLGCAGAAAAWALIALSLDKQSAWMAVVAALDAALLLRFVRLPAGAGRAALAVAGTLLAIALANWWIAGAQIGQQVGLLPWYSIPRMGWDHFWTLATLANPVAELAWYGVALAVAAVAGR